MCRRDAVLTPPAGRPVWGLPNFQDADGILRYRSPFRDWKALPALEAAADRLVPVSGLATAAGSPLDHSSGTGSPQ